MYKGDNKCLNYFIKIFAKLFNVIFVFKLSENFVFISLIEFVIVEA